ncbi:hypothetical protein [Rhodoblastus sp.]|uniref:hypothetical protein n=1 Tax=Rhodoblastus sp. TaxID=1962975 RepID=UPI0026140BCF|nr:hypothetical protein [Rhodoblastus sp.]
MTNRDHQTPPLSIAHLKSQGVEGAYIFCRSCGHSGVVAFNALGLPDAMPFPMIAKARRFLCSACGAQGCGILPDWSGYRAPGMGRM